MRTISSLQKPVDSMPSLSLPFSSQSAGPLLTKLNELRQKPQFQIQPIDIPLLQVLAEGSSGEDKVNAIGELTGLVEDYNFYDPRLIPLLMETYGRHEGKLKDTTLVSLLRIIRKISLHDIELIPFFHSILVNDKHINALWSLRVILGRRPVTQPGLIAAVSDSYKSSKGFNHEAASLAVMSAYLSHNQLGDIDDLQILARIADGKRHKKSSAILEGNKTYTITSYLDEVISKQALELKELVSERGDFVLFSAAAIRAEAVFRLAQRVGTEQLDIDELITVLESTSKDTYSPSRTNSIACVHELASKSHYLNGRMLSLLKIATKDPNDAVKENAYEGLQVAVCRHSVLADDLQPLFAEGIQLESNQQVRAYALDGLAGTLEVIPLSNFTVLESLINLADDLNTLPNLRALALLVIAKIIKQSPNIHPRLKEVVIRAARDNKYNAIKANALLVLANATNCKGFIETKDIGLFMTNADDLDPDIRSNAILGIKNHIELIKEGDTSYPDLEDIIRRHLHDDISSVRANVLYAFGNAINRRLVLTLKQADLELLLHIASTDLYEPARAATYALSVIINKDISKIDKPEYEDMIEILCIIFGGYLPGENDGYENSIKSALVTLENKFNVWKRTIDHSVLSQRKAIRRLTLRDELQNSALKQVSLRVNELYLELQEAQRTIKSLEVKNLSLELRLQREREIRIKLEHSLNSLALELEKTLNPSAKSLNKFGAKTILWLLERTLKHQGFHFGRMYNDLKAKLIVGFLGKKPVQKFFGVSAQDADEIASQLDLFSPEE